MSGRQHVLTGFKILVMAEILEALIFLITVYILIIANRGFNCSGPFNHVNKCAEFTHDSPHS